MFLCFFFNDTATPEIYTLSLHDALPIWRWRCRFRRNSRSCGRGRRRIPHEKPARPERRMRQGGEDKDRKSTRLNSSHVEISYAVFCLKKKKIKKEHENTKLKLTSSLQKR